jgi:transcriptional regulator with XRE-family HTH domain
MGRDGMGRDGMGRDGMGRDGMGRDGMGRDGMDAGAMDLGAVLRALRRAADLSQRQLAERAGVSQTAVARIESGRAGNPAFRTVERLVRAAGATLRAEADPPASGAAPPDPVPHEELRDAAGRRYPAHLDVLEVTRPEKWWGSWWTETMIPSRWPLAKVPPYTFHRRRWERDRRRRLAARGRRVRIRRAAVTGADGLWLWLAETGRGDETLRVGELRAHVEPSGLVVLDGVVVAPDWRWCGIGRRLVEALLAAAAGRPVRAAAGREGEFLGACGFRKAGWAAGHWVG